MVADLDALLTAAQQPPPYVLVGFSFGGLVSQLYARTHPNDVDGLVLVESNHPDEAEQFEAELTPKQIAADHREVNANEEGVDVYRSFAETQQAAAMPDVPLVVVTAGVPEDWPPGWDSRVFDRLRAAQQADLASLVPNGTQVIAKQSSHDVPVQQPEIIVQAVKTVLAQAD
jgi:pimeloyl-ACP methyl ester carboxylesterase